MNKFLQEYHQVFAFIFLLIGCYIIFFSGGSGGFEYFRPDFYTLLIGIDSILVWYFFTYGKSKDSKIAWILGFIVTALLGNVGFYFAGSGKEAQTFTNFSKCSDYQINKYDYQSSAYTFFGNESISYMSNKDLAKGAPFNITTKYDDLGEDYPKFVVPDTPYNESNISYLEYANKTAANTDKFNRFISCLKDDKQSDFVKCENTIYVYYYTDKLIDCNLKKLIPAPVVPNPNQPSEVNSPAQEEVKQ
jgi:hypothetical protein